MSWEGEREGEGKFRVTHETSLFNLDPSTLIPLGAASGRGCKWMSRADDNEILHF